MSTQSLESDVISFLKEELLLNDGEAKPESTLQQLGVEGTLEVRSLAFRLANAKGISFADGEVNLSTTVTALETMVRQRLLEKFMKRTEFMG
jgi:hypothetical protein